MVKHIAYIKDQQIINLQTAYGRLPEQGFQEDGSLILHLDFPIENGFEFIKRNYFYDGKFHHREDAPNQYCRWDIESRNWIWDLEDLIKDIRMRRNGLLARTDWTQLPDSPLSTDMKNAWATYRQELRDLTEVLEGLESLEDVPWPDTPA